MQSDFARRFASDFDVNPLHNFMWDYIGGDDQLAWLCDAADAADTAGDVRENHHGEDAELVEDVEKAWGKLHHVARERALEAVAESCATVIEDGDQWVEEGHWEQATIDAAKAEARDWLRHHSNEAERADVMGVLEVDG